MKSFKYEVPYYIKNVAEINKELFLDNANKVSKPVHTKVSFYTKYGKRFLDIVISLIALTITLPINLIIAIITYFDLGLPLFFFQDRQGRNEKVFSLMKFRNMNMKTNEKGELLPPGSRVTRMGKILRKTSLDELLNFVSILKGDMTIIGPRPLPTEYTKWMTERHKHRTDLRPGLECPQISNFDNEPTWNDKLENDIEYVENCSFLLDIKLVFRIIHLVLFPSKHRARGDQGFFVGYNENGEVIKGLYEVYDGKKINLKWDDIPLKTKDEYKKRFGTNEVNIKYDE